MISETRLAWLAGILDGEGSIGCSVHYHNYVRKDGTRKIDVRFQVVVTNTDESMIREVQDIAVTLDVPYYLSLQKGRQPGWKDVWDVRFVGGRRAEKLLTAVLPYLVTKKHRAELILGMIHRRREHLSTVGTFLAKNPAQDQWFMEQLGKLRRANARGNGSRANRPFAVYPAGQEDSHGQ